MPTSSRWAGARRWTQIVALAAVVLASACSSGDDGPAGPATSGAADTASTDSAQSPTTTEAPPIRTYPSEISGPVSGGSGINAPQPAAPLPDGYVEEEFFITGDAIAYEAEGSLDADGFWEVSEGDSATYRTRIIVRRPPADAFSGTVLVEWLNVTAIEASPDWGYVSEEIGRAGHAYVAVSVQSQGVMGGENLLQVEIDAEAAAEAGAEGEADTSGLVNIDPDRYASLTHPGDAYAYDIYSQVGRAIDETADTILGGLEPQQVIAVGESQSAAFLTTYVNAVHPRARAYDGFMIHSRGAGAAPLGGVFGEEPDDGEDASSFVTDGVAIRTDLDEVVFIFEAETDLTLLGYADARQPDTDTIRTWEAAGTAHSDAHIFRVFLGGPRDPAIASIIGCDNPINTGPHHEVYQAALSHLVVWAAGGPAPPVGDPLALTFEGDTAVISRDANGIALGGVRNPLVDVPISASTGEPAQPVDLTATADFDICDLFGTTTEWDQAQLVAVHGSGPAYLEAFRAASDTAVADGFLLPADAEQLITEAEANVALFG